jgi:hypothetical protein
MVRNTVLGSQTLWVLWVLSIQTLLMFVCSDFMMRSLYKVTFWMRRLYIYTKLLVTRILGQIYVFSSSKEHNGNSKIVEKTYRMPSQHGLDATVP